MTEKRLIQGDYSTRRYLHSDEIFCKERNWNIHLPSEREFKDGYCIITDKDDTAYSVDELVELLNEFQKENDELKKQITSLKVELNIHKHPLWSTREAERKVSELTDLLADEVKKNGELLKENNSLRIKNKRLLKHKVDLF